MSQNNFKIVIDSYNDFFKKYKGVANMKIDTKSRDINDYLPKYTQEEFIKEFGETFCPAKFKLVNHRNCGGISCSECWKEQTRNLKFKNEQPNNWDLNIDPDGNYYLWLSNSDSGLVKISKELSIEIREKTGIPITTLPF